VDVCSYDHGKVIQVDCTLSTVEGGIDDNLNMGNIRSKEGMKGQVNLNYVDPVQVEPKITSKEHDVSDSNLLTKPVVNRKSNRLRKVPARINDDFCMGDSAQSLVKNPKVTDPNELNINEDINAFKINQAQTTSSLASKVENAFSPISYDS
jgi:hypothetical protein